MRGTIDKAGRVVIPRQIREELGLGPGEVEITRDGAAIRIEPPPGAPLVEEGPFLVVPSSRRPLDDDEVRRIRDAGQR